MRGYTKRQQAILDFIAARLDLTSKAPTIREIMAHFRIRSTNGVHKHLVNIEKKGGLQRPRYGHRGALPAPSQPGAVATA